MNPNIVTAPSPYQPDPTFDPVNSRLAETGGHDHFVVASMCIGVNAELSCTGVNFAPDPDFDPLASRLAEQAA